MSAPASALAATPYWPYMAAAAVLTDFAADKLRPLGGGEPDIALVGAMLLDHGEPIRIGPAKGRWSLKGQSRALALAELKRSGALTEALKANGESDRPDNPTQHAIDEILASGESLRVRAQTLRELLGFERAIELLSGVVDTPPKVHADLVAQIERLRLLEPLQRLLEHGFAGRASEVATLRSYVDELESTSFREMVSRKLENVLDIFRTRPLLVIWGPGGVGKSTLIAKFLIDHAGPKQTKPTPFVYLDFDCSHLDPMRPDTLLGEALRQIRVQFPEFADKTATLMVDAETRLANEDTINITRSAHFRQSSRLRERFATLVAEIGKVNNRKVLLFIDTFEVVQRRGITPVFNVLTLAAQLVQASPRLRPVIAGRAPLRDSDFNAFSDKTPRWKALPLEGFDKEAGRAYLRGRLRALGVQGVPSEVLDRVVSLVRGNPLSLRLAAPVFRKDGVRALEDAVSEAEFEASFTQERLQGFLHNRIIATLDPLVAKLADPGLIVRRVTPQVILEVLAGACGLDVADIAAAEKLFADIQGEVSLFEDVGPFTLRHRPDVRMLMLPILRARLGEKARRIDEAAVHFWSTKDDPEARAEQIYHLIWLDRDVAEFDAVYARGIVARPLLDDALDEFEALDGPVQARVWLCGKLDREVSPELESQADNTQWERNAERRARSLLLSGSAQEALVVLGARKERTPASPLWLLEIQALKLLGKDVEAAKTVERALRQAGGGRAPAHVLHLLMQKAWLCERRSDLKGAFAAAAQATSIAKALNDQALFFEARLLETRFARLLRSEQAASLRSDLAGRLDEPSVMEALRAQPALVREAAAEIGDLRPQLFILAAERQGSGGSDAAGEVSWLLSAGVAYAQLGDLPSAVDALERARASATRVDDVILRARVLLQLAGVHYVMGRHEEAQACANEALSLGHAAKIPELEMVALEMLGSFGAASGRMDDATANYERALAMARETGNRRHEGRTLAHLANVWLQVHQFDRAAEAAEDSLSAAKELGEIAESGQPRLIAGYAYLQLGDRRRALDHLEQARISAQAAGRSAEELLVLNALGRAYAAAHEWDAAERALDEGVAVAQRIGDLASAAQLLGGLGEVYVQTARLQAARDAFERQLAIVTKLGNPGSIKVARGNVTRARELLGLHDEAPLVWALPDPVEGAPETPNAAPTLETLDFTREVEDGLWADELQRSMESAQGVAEGLAHQKL